MTLKNLAIVSEKSCRCTVARHFIECFLTNYSLQSFLAVRLGCVYVIKSSLKIPTHFKSEISERRFRSVVLLILGRCQQRGGGLAMFENATDTLWLSQIRPRYIPTRCVWVGLVRPYLYWIIPHSESRHTSLLMTQCRYRR